MPPSKVLGVGIGSAGCSILAQLGPSHGMDGKLYISCEPRDFKGDGECIRIPIPPHELERARIRAQAERQRDRLVRALENNGLLLLVAGLGGDTGSVLAPFVAEVGKELGISSMGFFVMPFSFEKGKHFKAGLALRRLKGLVDALVLVDGDALAEMAPREPLSELRRSVTKLVSEAMKALLVGSGRELQRLGLGKVVRQAMGEGYSFLGGGRAEGPTAPEEAVLKALDGISRLGDVREAQRAILYFMVSEDFSAYELASSLRRVEDLLGRGDVEVEYGVGIEELGGAQAKRGSVRALVVASGIHSTKFDEYDPLGRLLKGREIDDAPSSSALDVLEKIRPLD